MWLTPKRSSSSIVRSASACVTALSAAAPKMARVLWCPVRPKLSVGIIAVLLPRGSILGSEERTRNRVAATDCHLAVRQSRRSTSSRVSGTEHGRTPLRHRYLPLRRHRGEFGALGAGPEGDGRSGQSPPPAPACRNRGPRGRAVQDHGGRWPGGLLYGPSRSRRCARCPANPNDRIVVEYRRAVTGPDGTAHRCCNATGRGLSRSRPQSTFSSAGCLPWWTGAPVALDP